ncbi:hypothetical protein [Mycobacterium conspicuum]|jgi:hypothetical protein|uniref:Integral membrane protein n=1 Tax=Mycobacterium conspicuum TaxID=44010 RepID=A0A7I7YFA6_9MYCO|nr:hypothetical protein [Mycobacterium conspicuum]BBZ40087.1 integral membrane protein [Mycobacterium conspicuum]
MAQWFAHDIHEGGRLPLLCCLVAFILTFFVTRTFVRFIRHRAKAGRPARWWHPRNVYVGGVHIHHVTFGVVLVLLSGLTLVTLSIDGQEIEFTLAATLFGIGAALVLDEYALILHLSDVYWEEDGRTSVDAVFAAVAVAGLLILGLHPLMFFLPIWHGADSVALRIGVGGALALTLPLAVVVLLKGKLWTGLLGMFIVVLLVVGAVRLSRPHAPWARWRYTVQPDKMRRALQRERTWRRPVVRAKLWLQGAIAGTPRRLDERAIDAELNREVRPAPPPEGTEPILISR